MRPTVLPRVASHSPPVLALVAPLATAVVVLPEQRQRGP